MTRIEEIKAEIFKLEKLAELGIEIYKEDKDPEFLKSAVWYSSEADMWKRVLREEYGVVIE